MSDSDLGKLNKYMGGTDDAAQFTASEGLTSPPPPMSSRLKLAINAMDDLRFLQKKYNLTFDQAMQAYIIGLNGDPTAFPPVTERKG